MFEVNNGVTKIDGSKGKYDEKVTDPSVRYGRNAVENHYTYLEQPLVNDKMTMAPILDFGVNPDAADKNIEKLEKFTKDYDDYLNSLPPLEYEYRYMPQIQNGQIDKKAVLGSAYEEMGQVKELSVEELDHRFAPNNNYTSKALDINKDGKIDIAEYGNSILAADMLSKSPEFNTNNINGTINNQGFNAVLEYSKKSQAEAAAKLYSSINNKYNLQKSLSEFNAD